ncbi:MAG TPA: hypothetical protein VN114_07070 [Oxalicibacterium sp.]|uniref:hypothetical protein n=1 Tax=Oxalicibacterium sp. TaxID=2766525 RepID=UPI002B6C0251|nr:hypothetical protein [Oxalicibacterium sp.]HWU98257.1 hypothetical protein [Oxalicibacterium sp.]
MTEEHHTRAAQENHAFALMGRLHVTLRRQTGRVTDIEYMRIDQNYCRYLLKMTAESDNPDLRDISAKLQEIFFGVDGLFVTPEPRQALLSRLVDTQRPTSATPTQTTSASTSPDEGDAVDRGYIGRLR